ncbi:hypothetical protein DL764_009260 [Monosporascus ibericus]|uniref:Uncharacterized protein n=1 Tax=Monosporascus ibericus TaxID=155417 RepID=A0A4Q4SVH2_9PEZI|nr:hypothetical protein DL764_009260 [Monosporascus ibericus]
MQAVVGSDKVAWYWADDKIRVKDLKAGRMGSNGAASGLSLQLSHLYPGLSSIVQNRAPVLKQAEAEIWPQKSPEALKEGSVRFQQQDFFEPNRAEDVDVGYEKLPPAPCAATS